MATTLIFWPGEFHGLYSPWGNKELDMTEQLSLSPEVIGFVLVLTISPQLFSELFPIWSMEISSPI